MLRAVGVMESLARTTGARFSRRFSASDSYRKFPTCLARLYTHLPPFVIFHSPSVKVTCPIDMQRSSGVRKPLWTIHEPFATVIAIKEMHGAGAAETSTLWLATRLLI